MVFLEEEEEGAINLINFEIKLKLVQWNSSYTLNLMQDIIICVL